MMRVAAMRNGEGKRADFNRCLGGLFLAWAEIRATAAVNAMLALALGLAAAGLVFVYGVGIGTTKRVEQQIARLGANLIIVSERWGDNGTVGNHRRLLTDDLSALRASSDVDMATGLITTTKLMIRGGRNVRADIIGADASYLDVMQLELGGGRNFLMG